MELLNNNIVTIIIVVAALFIILKVGNKIIRKATSMIFAIYSLMRILVMLGVDISIFKL